MPKDSAGNFHFNDQQARAADRMPKAAPAPAMAAQDPMRDTETPFLTIFEDGMGGYRVEGADGTSENMPDGASLGQYVEQACGGGDGDQMADASAGEAMPDMSALGM